MIPVNNIYLSSEIGESVGTCTGMNEVRSMEIGHKSCHKSQAHRAKHLRTCAMSSKGAESRYQEFGLRFDTRVSKVQSKLRKKGNDIRMISRNRFYFLFSRLTLSDPSA